MAEPSSLRKRTPRPIPDRAAMKAVPRRSQRQTGLRRGARLHRAPRPTRGAASATSIHRLSALFPPYPSWRTRPAPAAVQTRDRRPGALRTGGTHRCKMADAAPPRAALAGERRGPPFPASSARHAPAPGRGTAFPSGTRARGAGFEERWAGSGYGARAAAAMVLCDVCGQALSSEAAARRHLQRPSLCRRQPRSPPCAAAAGCDELRRHMETAQPEPGPPGSRCPGAPPECPFCGEAAGQELEEHVRARHGHLLGAPGTGERRREGREGGRNFSAGIGGGNGEPARE